MAASSLGKQMFLHAKSWVPAVRASGNLFRTQTISLYNNVLFADDALGIILSSISISRCALDKGHHSQPALQKAEGFLSAASGVNSTIAGVMLWGQLLNGSMFFDTDENSGEFRRKIVRNKEGLASQQLQRRSTLTIMGKVSRLVAKTLGAVTCLSSFNIVHLSKHANLIGSQITSCFNLAATSCSLMESSAQLYQAIQAKPETLTDLENPRKPSTDFLVYSKHLRDSFIVWLGDFVDLIADIIGTVCSFLPAVLGPHGILIMAIIGLISYVINFIKDYAKIG